MNSTQRVVVICLLSAGLSVSGCKPGQLLGPTVTPTPLPTATPTNTPVPTVTPIPTEVSVKPGQWANPSGKMTFEVTTDGYVHDFTLRSIVAPAISRKCTVTFPPIPVDYDSKSFAFSSFEARLDGSFDSNSTVSVSYYISFCGNSPFGTGFTWTAEWIGP